jgi:hypothetical protein
VNPDVFPSQPSSASSFWAYKVEKEIMSDYLLQQLDTGTHLPGTDYNQVWSVTQLVTKNEDLFEVCMMSFSFNFLFWF